LAENNFLQYWIQRTAARLEKQTGKKSDSGGVGGADAQPAWCWSTEKFPISCPKSEVAVLQAVRKKLCEVLQGWIFFRESHL